ncbi:putative origin recognition complex subunit [Clavispora lusitaniae]|uniref:Origin recognition complex subunit n=1 Tax=Clavispora lusitaniae TaxID=36911 RepID=A0ACD0WEP7_CLALS|nr:Origin recognition complex, subunit 1 [Clavispora lusitaniae]QFZ25871.1 putative origin recognition complex subunit [Clavispora lusitaniae]QFZ30826.1 putative origin recognition complex subunit [Clavispora lusitaniae]QFZ36494.1 putative origin recognition complex subunit [Clavispora lusitaniae]QFZ42178.1 putative origin recognition complex subunit [Clavispora lusitaniae]
MAKRQKDLEDWKIVLDDDEPSDPSTPSRRSRRNAVRGASTSVKLHRETDDTHLEVGNCVLINGNSRTQRSGNSFYAVIMDIQIGVKNFLDLQVVPLVHIKNVRSDDLPPEYSNAEPANEVFVTSELEFVQLRDFVEKIQVLNKSDYSEIATDDTSTSTIFLCRRGCDRFKEKFSSEFDFKDWQALVKKNFNHALNYIAEMTSVIVSPTKANRKTRSLKSQLEQVSSPSRGRYSRMFDSDTSESEVSETETETEEKLNEEENEMDDEIEEPEEAVKQKTPRKRSSKSATTTPSPRKRSKRDNEAVKRLQSVLSPLKKGFKVKSGSTISSLPSLSRAVDKSDASKHSMIDTSSEAFKQLKEKLHTSTRIDSLPCREDEFTSLLLTLETAVREETGCSVYVSGTPGTGKTATIKEVIASLKEIVSYDGLREFDFLEINCLKLLTPNSAYEKFWEYLSGIKVTPSNAALLLEEYFSRDVPDPDRKPLIVLMDELDQIVTKNQNVMYNFFNWPTYANAKLIIIAVANTMDLPERLLSNKISSRLGLRRIQFVGYTYEQLGQIIKQRLEMLAEKNKRRVTVSPDAVGFASRKVASVSGDARRALTICRRAVEIAESEYLATAKDTEKLPESDQEYSIQISHISKAINETTNTPLANLVNSLSFASKLALVSVLLRTRRTGLAENTFGDICDEMRNTLRLLTAKESSSALNEISSSASYIDLLYSHGVLHDGPQSLNIRVFKMAEIINELVEQGILVQQNIRSERYRLIHLNVSGEEVESILKRNAEVAAML